MNDQLTQMTADERVQWAYLVALECSSKWALEEHAEALKSRVASAEA